MKHFKQISTGLNGVSTKSISNLKKLKNLNSSKKRRSDSKVMTRDANILKILRESRNISMRQAAILVKVSSSFINHAENGRMDLTPQVILRLITSYGYTYQEFLNFKENKEELPEALRHDCIEIIKRLTNEKLKTVKSILMSF